MSESSFSTRSPFLLDRNRSALVVIDVQEKLVPAIHDHSRLVWNIGRLLEGAKLFGVPCLATEQYPQGLGETVPALRAALETIPEKSMFSCRECQALFEPWLQSNVRQMVLTGIETHVCVQQTALDLVGMGFEVFVVVDATGSRSTLDRDVALQRMQSCGVWLTTAEAVMFEWCETSRDPQFKALSRLVRQTAPE